jgi:hypothetical protein
MRAVGDKESCYLPRTIVNISTQVYINGLVSRPESPGLLKSHYVQTIMEGVDELLQYKVL